MSLWGQRDRLSQLAVRFRQLRRLLLGNLVTHLLTGSLKVTSKGEGLSRYNEKYEKRSFLMLTILEIPEDARITLIAEQALLMG